MSEQKLHNSPEEEDALIQREFEALLDDYAHTAHRQRVEIITRAFEFAKAAHSGIRRRSGEPYILHPIAVARIVVKEIGLGSTSICSALLHDVVEDTDYTVEDIEERFGPKIAQIVSGLTKISGGVFGQQASVQAENFRKLILTMSEDVRVILIKIADRLHNMRTLGSMPIAKQMKIAGETTYIYAPLAHRLGLYSIKTELEDLSFHYEHPDTYKRIKSRLDADKNARMENVNALAAPIREAMEQEGYTYEIAGRVKSIYSIWKKMQKKNVTYDEIYDILALRIVFDPLDNGLTEKEQCWRLYSIITGIYKPHPERIRDWISMPKANGYEALHVTVMSPNGEWTEIQIRTRRMNDIAERGLAAHWKYKQGEQDDESELDKWLRTIKELLKNPETTSMEFMDNLKLNLFASEIFVFTPKGDIRTLPQGATALDFAFMLHSDLGTHCIGAKVNRKLVPLNYVLQGGDQVQVITSHSQEPQREWLDFVVTAHARGRLQGYFRKQDRQTEAKGLQILKDFLEGKGKAYNAELVNYLLKNFHLTQPSELFRLIGSENISIEQIENAFAPKKERSSWTDFFTFRKKEEDNAAIVAVSGDHFDAKKIKKIIVTEENADNNITFEDCCKPIPGDDVMAYRDPVGHIHIHKRSCPVAMRIKASDGANIVDVEWQMHGAMSFSETLEIRGIDKPQVLIQVIQVISQQYNINMKDLHFTSDSGMFTGRILLYVHDRSELDELIKQIGEIEEVNSVVRVSFHSETAETTDF